MIISKTPLRMSFFGGGTDFADYYKNSRYGYGTVISTALDMYVYIMVCKRFDDKIRVCYTVNEFVDSVDQIKHNIIREALKMLGIEKGIDIVYSADIPLSSAGIGLASSSALAVGVLNALHAYKGEHVSPEVLAREACEIEIERLSNPIGVQDQYTVAYGGFRKYKFHRDGSVTNEMVVCRQDTLDQLKNNFMLYFTGLTRVSSNILAEQKAHIYDKEKVLDAMVEMVLSAEQALAEGDVAQIGKMLDDAWNLKKQMSSGISNPLINEMYTKAKNAGAVGGKILGAGGGGFMLLFVPPQEQERVRSAMSEYKETQFGFETEGSRIIFTEKNRGE